MYVQCIAIASDVHTALQTTTTRSIRTTNIPAPHLIRRGIRVREKGKASIIAVNKKKKDIESEFMGAGAKGGKNGRKHPPAQFGSQLYQLLELVKIGD